MTTKILIKNNISTIDLNSNIESSINDLLVKNEEWSVSDAILYLLKLGTIENHKKNNSKNIEIDYSDFISSKAELAMFFKDSVDDESIVLDWSKVKKFQ